MPQSETYPNSNTINISYVIPSDLEVEENATFSIRVVDANGLPNTITQDSVTLPTNKILCRYDNATHHTKNRSIYFRK